MRLRLTHHARQRMQLRGISEEEIESVLTNFDTRHRNQKGDRVIYTGRVGGRYLKVVVVRRTRPPVVITVVAGD